MFRILKLFGHTLSNGCLCVSQIGKKQQDKYT